MERYLARPEADAPPPSAEFDHAWYVSQNPDWSRTHPHPFLHFLETGLPGGRRPRADIDMAFVRDVVRGRGRGMEEAALRVFDPKSKDGDLKPPLSREELKARQDRFYADARMRIERQAPDRGRRRLVFVQCGKGFDAAWLGGPRDYDVLLNYYQEGEANPRADTVVVQAGTKTTAIRRLLEERPDLLLRYDAVLFLDDDVEIGADGIDRLFQAMAAEKLDLAQPALTADSDSAWPFLKKPAAGEGVLRTSTVEIMAPALTRRALEQAGWVFAETVSGWGTDLLLGPGGAGGVRAGEPWRRRLGRGQARPAGRHTRRRLLRLSAPLRRRPRPRGQPRRRRFRRRAVLKAARARRDGAGLRRAATLRDMISQPRGPALCPPIFGGIDPRQIRAARTRAIVHS